MSKSLRSNWILLIVIGTIFLIGLIIGIIIIIVSSKSSLVATSAPISLGQTNSLTTNQDTSIEVNYCVTCPDNKIWTNTATINRIYTDGVSEMQTITKIDTGYNLRVVRTNPDKLETIINYDAPEIDGPPIITPSNSIITTKTDNLNHLVIDIVSSDTTTYIVPLVISNSK